MTWDDKARAIMAEHKTPRPAWRALRAAGYRVTLAAVSGRIYSGRMT